MKRLCALVVLVFLIISACAPKEDAVQTTIAQTQKAYEGNLATALAGTLAAGVAPTTQTPMIEATPNVAASPAPALDIGSTSVRPADGATMMYVPAGDFIMGWNDGSSNEKPEHKVSLDAYWIDRTEVTNAAYGKCVSAGRCEKAPALGEPAAPVISVPWDQAAAYCSWAGGRLPTEAEWEKAARGTDGRLYPWGNELDKTRLAQFTWDNVMKPTGSYPTGASPYGVLDMAGSAFEWVADWYSSNYHGSSPASNPQGPQSGKVHVIRGGWWEWCPSYIRCNLKPSYRSTYRNGTGNYGRGGSGPAWIYYPWAGFRCSSTDTPSG